MKINGELRISISRSDGKVGVSVRDRDASVCFVEIELTAEDYLNAFTVGAEIPVAVRGLDRVGLVQEYERIRFPLPDPPGGRSWSSRESDAAHAEALKHLPDGDGWVADGYFGSQDSFKRDPYDGQWWGQTMARRWVPKAEGGGS